MDRRVRAAAAIGGLLVFGAMAYPLVRGEAIGFDLPVRAAIHGWAFPALTVAMRMITMLGSQNLLAALGAILVWRFVKRGERQSAYLLAAGSLSAEALSELLKVLIHRPRPEVFFGLVPAETYSFPSGHAFVPAVYFGILAGILAAGARWRAAVVVLAAVLGFSRVYLGYHYPSDVVGGWALAVVWLVLWAMAADRAGRRRDRQPEPGSPPDR
ncbi:MAG: phosphatase PAP2 family protein [Bryobacteraceae bacterium]